VGAWWAATAEILPLKDVNRISTICEFSREETFLCDSLFYATFSLNNDICPAWVAHIAHRDATAEQIATSHIHCLRHLHGAMNILIDATISGTALQIATHITAHHMTETHIIATHITNLHATMAALDTHFAEQEQGTTATTHAQRTSSLFNQIADP
jgi:hypothetical protein